MNLYAWVIENKEIVKLIYTIVIGFICFMIVIKTNRLFRLSSYQGIRYFRNAFFFYGLAFVTRYLLGVFYFFIDSAVYFYVMKIVFEFFLIMAGFSLLYSLLWKQLEIKVSVSSLFNPRIAIFYGFALVIVLLDFLWKTYRFMFLLQIIVFSYAGIISYINYRKSRKRSFLKLYFIVIMLNLIAWVSYFAIATIFNWSQIGVINIYILNLMIFLLFLYGVVSATKK